MPKKKTPQRNRKIGLLMAATDLSFATVERWVTRNSVSPAVRQLLEIADARIRAGESP